MMGDDDTEALLLLDGATREIESRFEEHEQIAHIVVPLGPGLEREVWLYALRGFKGYRDALGAAPAAEPKTPPASAE